MKRLIGLVIAGILLTGCASITAIPLQADGKRKGGDVEKGIRYYTPKPYLLVMELPAPPNPPGTSGDGKKEKDVKKPAGDGNGKQADGDKNASQTNSPTAQPSDTSFSVTNPIYTAKIVYLPDYSQPMVLQMKGGVFGNTSMAPTLQDGWMLTSLTGSVDSGGAAIVSAITQMVGSIWGSAGAAAKTTVTKEFAAPPPWSNTVLPPGLYEFKYDASTGVFTGLTPIVYFCMEGPAKPDKDYKTTCLRK